jgi:cobalt-zinc-cadmium efflux system outer membrane protein
VDIIRTVVSFILCLGLSSALVAEEAVVEPAEEISLNSLVLNKLIQEALDNNSGLEATKFNALSKKADIGPAGTYPDPKLVFEYSNFPVDGFLDSNRTPMSGKQIQLSQGIPFPGKLSKKARAAKHRYRASSHYFDETQMKLIRDIKRAYYLLYLIHRKIEIQTENRALLQQFADNATTRYKVGKGLQQDVLKVQVELSEVLKSLIILEQQRDLQDENLNRLLNRPTHHQLGKPDSLIRTSFDFKAYELSSIYKLALDHRPIFKQAREMTEGAQAEVSFAKMDFIPDFEVGAKYRFREANPADSGVDFLSLSVGMNVPIFAFSKQREKLNSAQHRYKASQAQVRSTKQSIMHHVRTTYLTAEKTQKLIELYETSLLPQAQDSLSSAESAYRVNRVDFITLLNNEKALFKHRIGYEQTLVDYELSLAELEFGVGKPLGEWPENLSESQEEAL